MPAGCTDCSYTYLCIHPHPDNVSWYRSQFNTEIFLIFLCEIYFHTPAELWRADTLCLTFSLRSLAVWMSSSPGLITKTPLDHSSEIWRLNRGSYFWIVARNICMNPLNSRQHSPSHEGIYCVCVLCRLFTATKAEHQSRERVLKADRTWPVWQLTSVTWW